MPYSVIGYCNLLRQWKCKIVRASLGVIVALILLMNVSGFSIMNESMKINNDTEEYYEYIHEFSYHCAVKHNHQLLSDGFLYHVLKNGADLIYRRAGQNIPVPFYQVPV